MSCIFQELLAGDRVVRVFSVSRIVHPVVFDVFGFSGGWDGLWLDQEHGGMTTEQVRMTAAFARAIYAELHHSDDQAAQVIVVEALTKTPAWRGIADRLQRAQGQAQ